MSGVNTSPSTNRSDTAQVGPGTNLPEQPSQPANLTGPESGNVAKSTMKGPRPEPVDVTGVKTTGIANPLASPDQVPPIQTPAMFATTSTPMTSTPQLHPTSEQPQPSESTADPPTAEKPASEVMASPCGPAPIPTPNQQPPPPVFASPAKPTEQAAKDGVPCTKGALPAEEEMEEDDNDTEDEGDKKSDSEDEVNPSGWPKKVKAGRTSLLVTEEMMDQSQKVPLILNWRWTGKSINAMYLYQRCIFQGYVGTATSGVHVDVRMDTPQSAHTDIRNRDAHQLESKSGSGEEACDPTDASCALCGAGEVIARTLQSEQENRLNPGLLVRATYADQAVWVHTKCARFSSDCATLVQAMQANGMRAGAVAESAQLQQLLLSTISATRQQKCSSTVCGKPNATLRCRFCPHTYHYSCAVLNECHIDNSAPHQFACRWHSHRIPKVKVVRPSSVSQDGEWAHNQQHGMAGSSVDAIMATLQHGGARRPHPLEMSQQQQQNLRLQQAQMQQRQLHQHYIAQQHAQQHAHDVKQADDDVMDDDDDDDDESSSRDDSEMDDRANQQLPASAAIASIIESTSQLAQLPQIGDMSSGHMPIMMGDNAMLMQQLGAVPGAMPYMQGLMPQYPNSIQPQFGQAEVHAHTYYGSLDGSARSAGQNGPRNGKPTAARRYD